MAMLEVPDGVYEEYAFINIFIVCSFNLLLNLNDINFQFKKKHYFRVSGATAF